MNEHGLRWLGRPRWQRSRLRGLLALGLSSGLLAQGLPPKAHGWSLAVGIATPATADGRAYYRTGGLIEGAWHRHQGERVEGRLRVGLYRLGSKGFIESDLYGPRSAVAEGGYLSYDWVFRLGNLNPAGGPFLLVGVGGAEAGGQKSARYHSGGEDHIDETRRSESGFSFTAGGGWRFGRLETELRYQLIHMPAGWGQRAGPVLDPIHAALVMRLRF